MSSEPRDPANAPASLSAATPPVNDAPPLAPSSPAPQPTSSDAASDVGDDALVEMDLHDLAYGGDAVGRYQGRAVFVAGGLPGERVRARLTRERSSYARAALVDVLRPSPDRVAPLHPQLAESGGFQWQHLAYPAQLYWKRKIVRQLLTRIGKFPNPPVQPVLGMPDGTDPWRYRTVAQFAIGRGEGGQGDIAIGFRRAGSHDVLDMPECPLVHPALDALYRDVRGWMLARWGDRADVYAERFTLRVAVGSPEGAALLPGVPTDDASSRSDAATARPAGLLAIEARPASAFDDEDGDGPHGIGQALLAAVPGLVGVVILGLPGGRGRIVIGEDHVHERVGDKDFRISAGSFFQVNPAQTPVLVEQALNGARARPDDWAVDGYSGVGLFSLFLAERVAHVRAIESQPSAVADARASAVRNGIENVSPVEGVLERVLGTLRKQRERADIALVDPPRSGCHPRALTELIELGPRTLVYISCDPSTLARDLAILCAERYRLTNVQPVDMFPFTSHIECVAVCDRM